MRSEQLSEYESLFPDGGEGTDDLDEVQNRFAAASRPYLSSPWSWFVWAVVMPAGILATPLAFARRGPTGVLLVLCIAILLGGAVEIGTLLRRGRVRSTPLAAWALRAQGNVSLVAVALSVLLIWQELFWALPGLWLLLLGHSLFVLGGLAFQPFRRCGILFQVAGLVALWPNGKPLWVFAAATCLGNLLLGIAVLRARRARAQSEPVAGDSVKA
jgi:hypothetical protein